MASRTALYPLGAAATLEELEADPHPLLARLRGEEPVSWLPVLEAWLVTSRALALRVLRDPALYTVDDPRFSTAQVVGPSMLSLDGAEHDAHRAPFARPFRLAAVRERFTERLAAEADRLLDAVAPAGHAELRQALAGPLSVAAMVDALGLRDLSAEQVLGWYDAIVGAVTDITAGRAGPGAGREAFATFRAGIEPALDDDPDRSLVAAAAAAAGGLTRAQVVSNAAVLLFGGIETTEGMIANALWHLLGDEEARRLVERRPGLLENAVRHGAEPDRVLAAVLFTDIVGSTERAVAAGDRAWASLLAAHDEAVRRQLERFQGVELDTAGDGFFASFDGPARAIRCALAVRDAVRGLGLEVRAGVHVGECERAAGKLRGVAVSVGARVAALAGPGEVLVSRTVVDLVAGSGLGFEHRGEHALKGLPGTWPLSAVVP